MLHGVDSNTTQNTNPDTHTYSLQRRTRRPTSLYMRKAHMHMGERTGHARELRFNRTLFTAWTATQPKIPTLTHTHLHTAAPDMTTHIIICEQCTRMRCLLVGDISISSMFIRMTKRRYTIQSHAVLHGIKLLTGCSSRHRISIVMKYTPVDTNK